MKPAIIRVCGKYYSVEEITEQFYICRRLRKDMDSYDRRFKSYRRILIDNPNVEIIGYSN